MYPVSPLYRRQDQDGCILYLLYKQDIGSGYMYPVSPIYTKKGSGWMYPVSPIYTGDMIMIDVSFISHVNRIQDQDICILYLPYVPYIGSEYMYPVSPIYTEDSIRMDVSCISHVPEIGSGFLYPVCISHIYQKRIRMDVSCISHIYRRQDQMDVSHISHIYWRYESWMNEYYIMYIPEK